MVACITDCSLIYIYQMALKNPADWLIFVYIYVCVSLCRFNIYHARGRHCFNFVDDLIPVVDSYWLILSTRILEGCPVKQVFSVQEAAFLKEVNHLDYELYEFAQTLARQLTAQAQQRLSR